MATFTITTSWGTSLGVNTDDATYADLYFLEKSKLHILTPEQQEILSQARQHREELPESTRKTLDERATERKKALRHQYKLFAARHDGIAYLKGMSVAHAMEPQAA